MVATLYWDDIAVSLTDPDEPNGIEVVGTDNIIDRCNQTKDINILGTENIVQRTIVNGAADGIVVNAGATGTEILNTSVYGCSGAGITANETCTIKNTISYGNTGDDITVAAGKTVSGTSNLFGDAAAGGAGTYTDVAGTIFNDDPEFIDAAGANFRLLPTSPCRDVGADVGLTTDHEGKTVPMGSTFDIGAYEFPISSGLSPGLGLSGGNRPPWWNRRR